MPARDGDVGGRRARPRPDTYEPSFTPTLAADLGERGARRMEREETTILPPLLLLHDRQHYDPSVYLLAVDSRRVTLAEANGLTEPISTIERKSPSLNFRSESADSPEGSL